MNARLLLCLLPIFLASCKSLPKVYYCVSDPEGGALHCASTDGDKPFSLPIEKSGNYVCTSPDDTQKIATWMKRHCR